MNAPGMTLKILLPYQVLLEVSDIGQIIAETTNGSMGFLPRRLDCVAVLVPGILSFQPQSGAATYVAVDTGVLVKAGRDVSVSVRRAVVGPDLKQLRAEVESHFLVLDEDERRMRTALARVERGFVQRFQEVLRER